MNLRSDVAESWHRSAAAGVSVDSEDPAVTLDREQVVAVREAHRLAAVFPLLDDVLGGVAADCGAVMAVSDEAGQLLWVSGTSAARRAAESIGFVEGTSWDERIAGTNAPGMAISLDRAVSVIRDEHYRAAVHGWSCYAAPIHDPIDGALLGVLDVTGGDRIVAPQTLALVRTAARLAETELAQSTPGRHRDVASSALGVAVDINALGRDEAVLTVGTGSQPRSLRLSRRHSEILALLTLSPLGVAGDELAVRLYPHDGGDSTVRAELKRLRALLGDDVLRSRPYRLNGTITADWLTVEAELAAGDVRGALRAYRGPLLPRSEAPGIVALRESLAGSLRRAVLASGAPDLMSTWTRSLWGADDHLMWMEQRNLLAASSPLRAMVDAQIERIDREFG